MIESRPRAGFYERPVREERRCSIATEPINQSDEKFWFRTVEIQILTETERGAAQWETATT